MEMNAMEIVFLGSETNILVSLLRNVNVINHCISLLM